MIFKMLFEAGKIGLKELLIVGVGAAAVTGGALIGAPKVVKAAAQKKAADAAKMASAV